MYIIILFLALLSASYADDFEFEYKINLEGFNNTAPKKVQIYGDYIYIFSTVSTGSGFTTKSQLIKYDLNGNLIWSNDSTLILDDVGGMKILDDKIEVYNTFNSHFRITRFDHDGNFIDSNIIEGQFKGVRRVFKHGENYAVFDSPFFIDASDEDSLWFKRFIVTEGGEILDEKMFYSSSYTSGMAPITGFRDDRDEDGNLYLSATLLNLFSKVQKKLLFKFDSDYNFVSSTDVTQTHAEGWTTDYWGISRIFKDELGEEYIFNLNTEKKSGEANLMSLRTLDIDGVETSYKVFDDSTRFGFVDAIQSSSGEIIVVGSTMIKGIYRYSLMKMNQNFEVRKIKTWGDGIDQNSLWHIIEVDDGFILSGVADSLMYLAKIKKDFTDIEVLSDNYIKTNYDESNSQLKIIGLNTEAKIEIYNLNGRLEYSSKNYIKTQELIPLQISSSGTYLIYIQTKESTYHSKFIKP